jgi:hypothetical protein
MTNAPRRIQLTIPLRAIRKPSADLPHVIHESSRVPSAAGRNGTPRPLKEHEMYDLYPDWGPASHDPDNPRSREAAAQALQESLDLRDNGGQRPDDN